MCHGDSQVKIRENLNIDICILVVLFLNGKKKKSIQYKSMYIMESIATKQQ